MHTCELIYESMRPRTTTHAYSGDSSADPYTDLELLISRFKCMLDDTLSKPFWCAAQRDARMLLVHARMLLVYAPRAYGKTHLPYYVVPSRSVAGGSGAGSGECICSRTSRASGALFGHSSRRCSRPSPLCRASLTNETMSDVDADAARSS